MARKQTKAGIALLLILTLLLAACSNGGGNANAPADNADGTGNAAAGSEADNTGGAAGEAIDPFGPLPEKTTVTIFKTEPEGDISELLLPEGETLTNNRYTKAALEKLNIDVQFPVVVKGGAASAEKVGLMIASNDMTDIMTVSYKEYLELVKSDMIADLTDVFEKHASQQLKDVLQTDGGKALELATIDGKLYGVPTMGTTHNSNSLVWIRQDWLDKLGLQPPKTVDDLTAVVKAFMEKDPDGNGKPDTVGLPTQQDFVKDIPQMFGFDGIFAAYKAYPNIWVKGGDGTVQYGSIQPQVKDALAKLNEMYKAGQISKEFAINKSDRAAQDVVSNKAGVFFGPWWSGWYPLNDAIRNDPSADWRAYTLLDADGKSTSKQETPIGSIAVVKKSVKYPEAMIKLLNYGYQVQLDDPAVVGGDPYAGLPLPSWQTLPISFALWRADSVILDHTGILAASKGEALPDVIGTTLENYKKQGEYWAKGVDWLRQNPDFYGEPISRIYGVQPIIDNKTEPVYSEFYGYTKTMERRWTNLEKLQVDAFIKIITGEKPIGYFDEFVSQWKSQGGDTITKEVGEALS